MFLDPSLLVRAENATLNAAAEPSAMLQCYDIRQCRTLPSIIFACFSTVFLCTWTALHLNLPYPSLLSRIGSMLLALFAPEGWFMEAFEEWTESSNLLGKILRNYPECGWTETHAQFIRMGGFRLVGADEKTFAECVENGTIELPKVSKEEILARSKGDNIAKIITVIQIAWFVIQCIHRRSQHLLLTQLEITTLAHTLINFFIYFFWWYKPYGVALPIEVPFKERRPETIEARDDNLKMGSLDGNDNIQMPQTADIGETPAQPPPISNDDSSRASEKGVPVAATSNESKSPTDKEPISDVEATNGTPSTSPQLSWYTQLGIKTLSFRDPEELSTLRGRIVLNIIYFIVGGGFGAMHCLAWNSTFPTRAEQYTWQVSSLIVTVFGGAILVWGVYVNQLERKSTTDQVRSIDYSILIIGPMYALARVSLLVLALLQLRALPYAGYATPSWSVFYPHIG